jgi:hypothetical protein
MRDDEEIRFFQKADENIEEEEAEESEGCKGRIEVTEVREGVVEEDDGETGMIGELEATAEAESFNGSTKCRLRLVIVTFDVCKEENISLVFVDKEIPFLIH